MTRPLSTLVAAALIAALEVTISLGAEPARQSVLTYHADPGRSGNFNEWFTSLADPDCHRGPAVRSSGWKDLCISLLKQIEWGWYLRRSSAISHLQQWVFHAHRAIAVPARMSAATKRSARRTHRSSGDRGRVRHTHGKGGPDWVGPAHA